MAFDAKFLTILAFVTFSFLIIFVIRNRSNTAIALIITHLILLLFLSLSVTNYDSFKKISLAVIFYLLTLLFLILNQKPIFFETKKSKSWQLWISYFSFGSIFIIIFLVAFFIVKDVAKISQIVAAQKSERQNEISKNPMISPSHSVHVTIKKFYLEKKSATDDQIWLNKLQPQLQIEERKRLRLQSKLIDNFLLRNFSDAILFIAASSCIAFFLNAKKTSSQ
ncbi:MAG: hypothetical protein SFV53_04220 [Rickettsiales bacterium]|nr:hypothetical protein [Rickettsiales bacterium]